MIDCLSCAVGYHAECWKPTGLECCCAQFNANLELTKDNAAEEMRERGGQIKSFKDVKDLESTGRKRAAKLYPIPKEGEPGYPMKCEWQFLGFAGGGVIPIVGCFDGMAEAIHHGPDKNTLANHVGNVHRICPKCHNRWHTINDQFYAKTRPEGDVPYVPIENDSLPHDGLTRVVLDIAAQSEANWALKSAKEWLLERLEERES